MKTVSFLFITFSFLFLLSACQNVSQQASEQAYQYASEEASEASEEITVSSNMATDELSYTIDDKSVDGVVIASDIDMEEPENPVGDKYNTILENPFVATSKEAVSTFSIDADGASYTNVRRFIEENQMIPPAGAIRTEEMINFFDMNYNYESSEHPISLNGEVAKCPWTKGNQLVRIGIKGKLIAKADLPASNFVFLIDVFLQFVLEVICHRSS